MTALVETEVIPVWFIEKWKKENCEEGSTLDFFMDQMIREWKVEEIRLAHQNKQRPDESK